MADGKKFYATSFALTKLTHGFITTKKGAKCLVIPIAENYLSEKEGAVYMQTDICVREEKDTNENYGFVKQKLPSDIYKSMDKEAAKEIGDKLPFLANLKIFERANNDTSGASTEEFTEEEESDLPF